MLVVAITGGIGSGKTQVSRLFRQLKVPYLDADEISRQLSSSKGAAYPAIVSHFGQTILEANGHINRPALRKIIFSQPEQRAWLEQLLHPLILAEMKQKAQELDAPYCTAEIPLLAESGKKSWVDRVLVVDAPSRLRIDRVKKRDSLNDAEVKTILSIQATRKERLTIADDVIENTGSLPELSTKINTLHNYYLLLAKKRV